MLDPQDLPTSYRIQQDLPLTDADTRPSASDLERFLRTDADSGASLT